MVSTTPIPGAKYRITVEAEATRGGFFVPYPNVDGAAWFIHADAPLSVEPVEILIDGEVYKDRDGIVSTRRSGGWVTHCTIGDLRSTTYEHDDFMRRPLTRLVPEGEALRLLDEHWAVKGRPFVCNCGAEGPIYNAPTGVEWFHAHLRDVVGGAR